MKIKDIITLPLAIIGGIATIISIYTFFSEKKAKVEATVYYSEMIQLPEQNPNSHSYQGYYTINIQNQGSAISNNIQIYIPDSVAYATKNGFSPLEINPIKDSKIRIQELAPKEKLNYIVWTQYPISSRWDKKISAYDETGTINIKPLFLAGKAGHLLDTFIQFPLMIKALFISSFLSFILLIDITIKRFSHKTTKQITS